MFDANALSALPPFSKANYQHTDAKAYLAYYRINFVKQGIAQDQSLGRLSLGSYDIFTHQFTALNPTGSVILIHGYFDHSANLRPLIEHFLKKSLNVIVFDLPGHGLSSGDRSVIHSFKTYQAVLADLIIFLKQRLDFPLSLICGHSTGGAVAMQHVLSQDFPEVEKLLLIAPLVEPIGWPWIKWQRRLAHPFIKTIPRKYKKNTSNQEFWHFIRHKDPLQTQVISVDWLKALEDWLTNDFAPAAIKKLPVLMLQGKNDSTVNGKRNALLLKEKFPNMECVFINQAKHQLVNESCDIKKIIFNSIHNFLSNHQTR
jgi:alpha-beta hydrolase superfamily lysophospholipase